MSATGELPQLEQYLAGALPLEDFVPEFDAYLARHDGSFGLSSIGLVPAEQERMEVLMARALWFGLRRHVPGAASGEPISVAELRRFLEPEAEGGAEHGDAVP